MNSSGVGVTIMNYIYVSNSLGISMADMTIKQNCIHEQS
jgi:hypothetical protein